VTRNNTPPTAVRLHSFMEDVMMFLSPASRNLAIPFGQILSPRSTPRRHRSCISQVDSERASPQRSAPHNVKLGLELMRSVLDWDFPDEQPRRRGKDNGWPGRFNRRRRRSKCRLAIIALAGADHLSHTTAWLFWRGFVDARKAKTAFRLAHRIRAWGLRLVFQEFRLQAGDLRSGRAP